MSETDSQKQVLLDLIECYNKKNEPDVEKIISIFEDVFENITERDLFGKVLNNFLADGEKEISRFYETQSVELLSLVEEMDFLREKIKQLSTESTNVLNILLEEKNNLEKNIQRVHFTQIETNIIEKNVSILEDCVFIFQGMYNFENFLKKGKYLDGVLLLEKLNGSSLCRLFQFNIYNKIVGWILNKKKQIRELGIENLETWFLQIETSEEIPLGKLVFNSIDVSEVEENIRLLERIQKVDLTILIETCNVFEYFEDGYGFRNGYSKNRRRQFQDVIVQSKDFSFQKILERISGFHLLDLVVSENPRGLYTKEALFGVWIESAREIEKRFNKIVFESDERKDLLSVFIVSEKYCRTMEYFGFSVEGIEGAVFIGGSKYIDLLQKESVFRIKKESKNVMEKEKRKENSSFIPDAETLPSIIILLEEIVDHFVSELNPLIKTMKTKEKLLCSIASESICSVLFGEVNNLVYQKIEEVKEREKFVQFLLFSETLISFYCYIKEKHSFLQDTISFNSFLLEKICFSLSETYKETINNILLCIYNKNGSSDSVLLKDLEEQCLLTNETVLQGLPEKYLKKISNNLCKHVSFWIISLLSDNQKGKFNRQFIKILLLNVSELKKIDKEAYEDLFKIMSLIIKGNFKGLLEKNLFSDKITNSILSNILQNYDGEQDEKKEIKATLDLLDKKVSI